MSDEAKAPTLPFKPVTLQVPKTFQRATVKLSVVEIERAVIEKLRATYGIPGPATIDLEWNTSDDGMTVTITMP